jgi:uncharacterized membrane protein YkvA (DUF1232 family)
VASRLRRWAEGLKRDVLAIWFAARDPRVPWPVKLLAAAVAAYALSPVDLIPDFIPVIGYLDDLIIVPLGILLIVKLMPPALMAEHRARAERALDKPPRSWAGAAAIALIWIVLLLVAAWWIAPLARQALAPEEPEAAIERSQPPSGASTKVS